MFFYIIIVSQADISLCSLFQTFDSKAT